MMMHKLLPAALACLFAVPAVMAAENMVTVAEKSQFTKTGRYTEVDTLCKNFQKNYPKWVRCQEIGRSPEGRPILVLIASKTGALTPL